MNYYIKQRFSLWNDRFSIYDGQGNEVYVVEGEVFTFGKKLHLYDTLGNELAFIHEKALSFKPRFYIYRAGIDTVEVVKEFTFFKPEYTVNGLGWKVRGDFWDHEYTVDDGYNTVVSVTKRWFTLGDAYEMSISEGFDTVAALAVVLVIDACIDAQERG